MNSKETNILVQFNSALHYNSPGPNPLDQFQQTIINTQKFIQSDQQKVVYVKMQIKIQFGKALYLVGDCKELGNWDLENSCKMEWTEDNYWRGSFAVHLDAKIQYKYVIGNYNKPSQGSLRWQSGANRILYAEEVQGKNIYLNQRWNHQKIKLQLITQDYQQQEEIYVIGNCIQLGVWISKRFMTKQKVIEMEGQLKSVWTISFYVQKQKDLINYRYIKVKGTQQYQQRQPSRIFNLKQCHKNIDKHGNRITIIQNPGQICIIDYDGFLGFKISQIIQNIYIGAFLKFQQEIQELVKNNIKVVLNLQTKQDMKNHGLNWRIMKQLYEKNNIKAYNFEIVDMKIEDFITKSRRAVELMRDLILKYGTIYVHCTAGIYRSPQVVILYLIKYFSYTIQSAIKLIKDKRSYAHPHEKCIEMSIKYIEEDAEKENVYDMQLQKLNLKI